FLAVGTSGGDYRPQQHALLLTNFIDYGLDLQSAVELPRFLWNGGAEIIIEEGLHDLDGLKKIGHQPIVQRYPSRTGVAHCGVKKGKVTVLSADIRGDGLSLGLIS
ncbi:TPA: gamma-glutamyltransferase, partial [Candidatus Bathyarchaeota archaeon]|nr:gamma-glutamyltransferase [Candidatus Bathyarchaeota archaeon]